MRKRAAPKRSFYGMASMLMLGLVRLIPGDRADVVMPQPSAADPVDPHDQSTGGIGADDPSVGLHPVGRMVPALLGRQQGDSRLQGEETEAGAIGHRELAAAEIEAIPNRHIAGAVSLDRLHDN